MRLVRNAHWIARDFASAWSMRGRRFIRRADAMAYLVGTEQPVVAIPGVYERWEFMKPLAERINALGHPVHVLTELGRNTAPIPETAVLVADYLERHELRQVVLLTHSKGGIVGKHLMLFDDPHGRVDRMIALAAPFSGSSYARYIPARALKPFVPGSETLAMLSKEADVDNRITSIFPAFDGHLPAGSALAGATNVEVPVRGHFRVLVEEPAIAAVLHALDGGT